jgi:hypothetical protein
LSLGDQQVLNRSPTGAIVHDIKLKAKKFVSCTFKHVSRLYNVAAHILAKSAEYDSGFVCLMSHLRS